MTQSEINDSTQTEKPTYRNGADTIMKKLILSLSSITLVSLVLNTTTAFGQEIVFEAENAEKTVSPVRIVKIENEKSKQNKVSGNKFIEIKQGAGTGAKAGGSATYKFKVTTAGNYYLWARVWWLDSCGNSFMVKLNNGPSFTFGNDNTYQNWHWVKARVKLKLKKGEQTLQISNREDGIKIDQFFITSDREHIPVGIEKNPAAK